MNIIKTYIEGMLIIEPCLFRDARLAFSEKDTKHELLKDFDSPFDINETLYGIEPCD